LPDGSVMVEAAHLIPFSESCDNDPRNGIALVPSFHWALDRNILSPGPDLKWHVSKILDKRNRDYHELLELDKKPIILPMDRKYYPRPDALEWRINKLID
jgi:putative restriction endonuclease